MTTADIKEGVEIRAFSHQSTNDKVFEIIESRLAPGVRLLDLGAGEGFFSKATGDYLTGKWNIDPSAVVSACDVAPENFRYRSVTCDPIPSDGRLPYEDNSFDVVCSLEVVEHVEDHFAFCREIVRVLRPGGLAVLSTPNVQNLNSRYRNLHSGFATLFNPLSLSSVDALHTSGHIHPVGYYYLAYALYRAGARDVAVQFDRFKQSALFILFFFWPFVLLGNLLFRLKLQQKNGKLVNENAELLRSLRSLGMLTSRSIIVTARV